MFISCVWGAFIGGFLHHNNTKKILTVAGIGIAAAAIAAGMFMHIKNRAHK